MYIYILGAALTLLAGNVLCSITARASCSAVALHPANLSFQWLFLGLFGASKFSVAMPPKPVDQFWCHTHVTSEGVRHVQRPEASHVSYL